MPYSCNTCGKIHDTGEICDRKIGHNMDEVEKIARELHKTIRPKFPYEGLMQCDKAQYMELARFVLRREIEAKIQETESILNLGFYVIDTKHYMSSIREQLAELRKQLKQLTNPRSGE